MCIIVYKSECIRKRFMLIPSLAPPVTMLRQMHIFILFDTFCNALAHEIIYAPLELLCLHTCVLWNMFLA